MDGAFLTSRPIAPTVGNNLMFLVPHLALSVRFPDDQIGDLLTAPIWPVVSRFQHPSNRHFSDMADQDTEESESA